jgi:acetyltransferase
MSATTIEPAEARISRRIWVARDGTPVLLRPIEPGDFELERQFVAGLSRNTGYQRLMSARRPTEAELRRWTDIDPELEGAMVATITVDGREQQIGVARYVREPGESAAEFAIVLGDAWQGAGLGRQLLSALIDHARQQGIGQLFGTTFSDNLGMLGLAQRLGFRRSRVAGAGFLTMLRLTLA